MHVCAVRILHFFPPKGWTQCPSVLVLRVPCSCRTRHPGDFELPAQDQSRASMCRNGMVGVCALPLHVAGYPRDPSIYWVTVHSPTRYVLCDTRNPFE